MPKFCVMTHDAAIENRWKRIMDNGRRKFGDVRSTADLRTVFMNDFLRYDFSTCGAFRPDCNVILARNKHKLAFVTSFFETCAEYGFSHFSNGHFDPTPIFKRVCLQLDGVSNLSIGPMHIKDDNLKFSSKKDITTLILELIAFSLELRLYLDGHHPNPKSLEEVINSQVLEGGKNFLGKIGLGSGKKALLKPPDNPIDDFEIIDMPALNLGETFADLLAKDIFSLREIEDLQRKNAQYLAKFKRVEPHLMPFYIAKALDSGNLEENFRVESSELLASQLRGFFPEEDMQDSLVQEALEKCDYMPEAAANWIVEQRKESVDLLRSKFPSFTPARAAVIGEKCKYNKNLMLILANVDVMNKVERVDVIDDLPEFLIDITKPEDTRIDIACLELFGDIDMFDSNIRARRLIEMLSFKDIVNQPPREGWWDSFNNYSFEDLVSFIADVPDPSVPHIYDSKILNNQCDVCMEYYHKNKIIEFDCGCISCVECVLQRLKIANDGKNLEEAMQCPTAACPQNDMNEDEKRNAFNVRYQQLCAFGQQFPEHKEVFNQFEENYNRHAALLLANFTLCAHPPCKNGQVQGDPGNNCMTCHECRKKTCYSCKSQWFDEHAGMNCNDYSVWLRKKHPDVAGLSEASDPFSFIKCPDCDSIFHLQRGGCIHFTCKQCGADFCGFCSRIFFNKKKPCRECEPKKQDALHAHHPRNCFYYLRDESLEWLIELLEESGNDWKQNLPKIESENENCPVRITTDEETKEHPCGAAPVKQGLSFCEKHLKEFLSIIIYENKKVDPITKLALNYLKVICERENIAIPPNATEEMLRQSILQVSPLDDDAD